MYQAINRQNSDGGVVSSAQNGNFSRGDKATEPRRQKDVKPAFTRRRAVCAIITIIVIIVTTEDCLLCIVVLFIYSFIYSFILLASSIITTMTAAMWDVARVYCTKSKSTLYKE